MKRLTPFLIITISIFLIWFLFNSSIVTKASPGFDFSLTVDSTSGTVPAGQSVSTKITANLIGTRTTEQVTFFCSAPYPYQWRLFGKVEGREPKLYCYFNPGSCGPTCSSTLTIYPAFDLTEGTYPITINAVSGNLTRTIDYTLIVTPPTTGQCPAGSICNEWGIPGWCPVGKCTVPQGGIPPGGPDEMFFGFKEGTCTQCGYGDINLIGKCLRYDYTNCKKWCNYWLWLTTGCGYGQCFEYECLEYGPRCVPYGVNCPATCWGSCPPQAKNTLPVTGDTVWVGETCGPIITLYGVPSGQPTPKGTYASYQAGAGPGAPVEVRNPRYPGVLLPGTLIGPTEGKPGYVDVATEAGDLSLPGSPVTGACEPPCLRELTKAECEFCEPESFKLTWKYANATHIARVCPSIYQTTIVDGESYQIPFGQCNTSALVAVTGAYSHTLIETTEKKTTYLTESFDNNGNYISGAVYDGSWCISSSYFRFKSYEKTTTEIVGKNQVYAVEKLWNSGQPTVFYRATTDCQNKQYIEELLNTNTGQLEKTILPFCPKGMLLQYCTPAWGYYHMYSCDFSNTKYEPKRVEAFRPIFGQYSLAEAVGKTTHYRLSTTFTLNLADKLKPGKTYWFGLLAGTGGWTWSEETKFQAPLHQYPKPDFSWQPENPKVGQEVQFTDKSQAFGGAVIAKWQWTFQDGNPQTSSEKNPKVKFISQGDKNVNLRVWDSDGYTCDIAKTLKISEAPANNPPRAAISCDPSLCGTTDCIAYTGCVFTFINNSTDPDGQADIIKSEWDIYNWGGRPDLRCTPPNALCNFTPQTMYIPAGTYTVELYVEDKAGASSKTTIIFYLREEARAGFMCSLDNINWKICENLRPAMGQLVYFKDDPSLAEHSVPSQGATKIVSRTWKIDGQIFNSDNNPNPSTNLNKTSNKVELTIRDDQGRTASKTHSISAELPLPIWKEIAPF